MIKSNSDTEQIQIFIDEDYVNKFTNTFFDDFYKNLTEHKRNYDKEKLLYHIANLYKGMGYKNKVSVHVLNSPAEIRNLSTTEKPSNLINNDILNLIKKIKNSAFNMQLYYSKFSKKLKKDDINKIEKITMICNLLNSSLLEEQRIYDYNSISFLIIDDILMYCFLAMCKEKGVVSSSLVESLLYIIRNTFCGMFFNGSCYLSFYPKLITFDDENKLHNIKHGAITFVNGDCSYYIHGIRFDKGLWNNIIYKDMSVINRLAIRNIEQRYASMKIIEPKRILDELGGTLMSETERGNKLYSIEGILRNQYARLLVYSCPSTDKRYYKFVPNHFINADEAQAWSYGLTLYEYQNIEKET